MYASRAPQADIARLKTRMGWEHIGWVTLTDSFDKDFGVDEWHGHNAFIRDGEQIYRTYFINGRGDEAMGTVWSYLDMTALGRQEEWEDSPKGYPQGPRYKWWNWHDSYVANAAPTPEGDKVSGAGEAAFRKGGDQHHDNDDEIAAPKVVSQAEYLAEVAALRTREKTHMRESDAIAAARRRLPMMEIDASTRLIGAQGPMTLLEAFEGRRLLIAYYFMWHKDKSAAEQCEGCTFFTTQVRELANINSREVTYATLCQGPYEQSRLYRDFMGWTMPWYSAQQSLQVLLAGRRAGMMHLVCYLRQDTRVYETYWTTMRGVEAMDNSYRLLDLTAYGRQETWEDSPAGWPQGWGEGKQRMRSNGRPIAQWSRLEAGYSDQLEHDPV